MFCLDRLCRSVLVSYYWPCCHEKHLGVSYVVVYLNVPFKYACMQFG
jgi:hypothetical protein